MKKGNLGVVLPFYGVLAFILAILGQTFLCGLLVALVLVVEKDETTGKTVIQAFSIVLLSTIISMLISIFNPIFAIPFVGVILANIADIIEGLFDLAILIFAIMGLFKAKSGEAFELPLVGKFASWAYGAVAPKPVVAQQPMQPQVNVFAAPQQPAQPQAQPFAAPQQPTQPQAQPFVAPQQPTQPQAPTFTPAQPQAQPLNPQNPNQQ